MSTATLRDEVTDLLQRLIRVDTTNPPGNETAAAELLRDYLEASGIECELIAKVPERANLVARIRGGDGPSLLFLGHTDVVLADPAEWSVPPFSGELRDGMVWGRGALDMKSEVAANAVAMASLAREGFRPSGDLIFAATADEEAGAGFGLEWLCEEHPDAVRCDFAINEGGGDRIELEDGRPIYTPTVAEKMTAPFRLRVLGRSGHASMPGIADNALVKAARLVERIAAFRPEPQLGPEVEAFLSVLFGEVPPVHEAVQRIGALSPAAGAVVEALLAPTFSPTIVSASLKRNVIPAVCELEVDCRLLPGQHPEHVEPMIRAVLDAGSGGGGGAGPPPPRPANCEAWGGRVRARVDRGTGRHPLTARHASVASARRVGCRGRARSEGGSARVCRLHGQPLAARGIRHRCLRLLPVDGRAAARGGGVARPLRRRAHPGVRSRAGSQLVTPRRARSARLARAVRLPFGAMAPKIYRWASAALPTALPAKEKIRLGGMALPNGVLVHGPHSWACAIRHEDGRIEVASARKRLQASRIQNPFLRGPVRLAEALALLPQIKAKLPAAKLPLESPRTLASMLGAAVFVRGLRESGLRPVARELLSAIVSVAPAVFALRSGELAAYHGAEHISIGTYEHGKRATKEHERCGGHLVGPLVATSAVGNVLAGMAPERHRRQAQAAAQIGAIAVATELFAWMTRHPDNPVAQALARPGHELQHRFSTAEPSDEQLEVAEAALAACLELEHAEQSA